MAPEEGGGVGRGQTVGRWCGERDLTGSRKVTLLVSHKRHSGLCVQEGQAGVKSVGRGCFVGSSGRLEPGWGRWRHK